MFTWHFWKQALERAIKSFVQGAFGAYIAAGPFSLFALDLRTTLGFGLGGFLLSVCTSILSLPVGQSNSPSLVKT